MTEAVQSRREHDCPYHDRMDQDIKERVTVKTLRWTLTAAAGILAAVFGYMLEDQRRSTIVMTAALERMQSNSDKSMEKIHNIEVDVAVIRSELRSHRTEQDELRIYGVPDRMDQE